MLAIRCTNHFQLQTSSFIVTACDHSDEKSKREEGSVRQGKANFGLGPEGCCVLTCMRSCTYTAGYTIPLAKLPAQHDKFSCRVSSAEVSNVQKIRKACLGERRCIGAGQMVGQVEAACSPFTGCFQWLKPPRLLPLKTAGTLTLLTLRVGRSL